MLTISECKSCNSPRGYCMALFFTFLLMSGCAMVGPDFQTPEAQVAQAWSQAGQETVTQGSADHETWWQNFNDPALNDLIDKAYSQNLGLQIAGLRVYEARALLGFAVGTLYPQSQSLSGSASTIKISENSDPVSALPPGFFDPDFDPAQRTSYHARVIEIPTPRWTAYEAKRFNLPMSENVPMTTQERAYSSPIWYTP